MKGTLRNVIIAFAVVFAVGFCFGFLGAITHDSSLGSLGSTVGLLAGAFTFFILQFRQGNRRVTFADSTTLARALAFNCPPDKSLLYIVRTGFMGKAVGIDIQVDGLPAAQLQSPRFTCVEVAPGEHLVTGKVGDGTSKFLPSTGQTPVNLVAGTVTVLHLHLERGMSRSQIAFTPWSMEAAKSKLAGLRMVLPKTQPL